MMTPYKYRTAAEYLRQPQFKTTTVIELARELRNRYEQVDSYDGAFIDGWMANHRLVLQDALRDAGADDEDALAFLMTHSNYICEQILGEH